jgi:hypothetical protein
VLMRPERLTPQPDAPAQCLQPDMIMLHGGDVRVPPSLAFGVRERKDNPLRASVVVMEGNRKR